MHITNMPNTPVQAANCSNDVALEELYLGPDAASEHPWKGAREESSILQVDRGAVHV